MESGNNALVATSVNPSSNLDYQLLCFRRWQKAGFRVLTFNVRAEADLLATAGLSEDEIHIINEDDSAKELFRKPIPRIMPVLTNMLGIRGVRHFVLTNADIYPSVRSSTIANFWESSRNGCLAMTREECHAVEAYSYLSDAPYRGGLDIFYMTRDALQKVIKALRQCSASDRMAFGIPGWDYLLGACMISESVGGAIMDSATLLHRTHRPTYDNVDEFGHYTADMKTLGVVTSDASGEAAHQFSRRIDAECRKNWQVSKTIKTIYFKPTLLSSVSELQAPEVRHLIDGLGRIASRIMDAYRRSGMTSLAKRLVEEEDATLDVALSYFVSSPSELYRFAETLVATAFAAQCRRLRGSLTGASEYPPGNQHAAAIRQVLEDTEENSPSRRLRILELFGAELIDHGIFNPRLYDYLILSSENDQERDLLADVRNTMESLKHAA